MSVSLDRGVTAGELWEMPEVPSKRLELVDGTVSEVPGAGALHAMIDFALARTFEDFVRQHDLGLVLPDGLAYVLRRGPDQVWIPAVSFIAWEHVPEEGIPERFWDGLLTLAVEVVSPNDRANDIQERVQDYLKAGTQQVWVLWYQRHSVSVYSPGADTRQFSSNDHITGGDVLSGFDARVGDLFGVRRRR